MRTVVDVRSTEQGSCNFNNIPVHWAPVWVSNEKPPPDLLVTLLEQLSVQLVMLSQREGRADVM
jgi:hypothetical protein